MLDSPAITGANYRMLGYDFDSFSDIFRPHRANPQIHGSSLQRGTLSARPPIPDEAIMDLLGYLFASTHFQYYPARSLLPSNFPWHHDR